MLNQSNYHNIFTDAQIVKTMAARMATKSRILDQLLSDHKDIWQVIGITKNALIRFKEHDFMKETGMRINRSHIQDRNLTNRHLLENPFTEEEWWSYFRKHNKTILAISEENKNISKLPPDEILYFKDYSFYDSSLNLFVSSSFAWRHTKKEKEFLINLYNSLSL